MVSSHTSLKMLKKEGMPIIDHTNRNIFPGARIKASVIRPKLASIHLIFICQSTLPSIFSSKIEKTFKTLANESKDPEKTSIHGK